MSPPRQPWLTSKRGNEREVEHFEFRTVTELLKVNHYFPSTSIPVLKAPLKKGQGMITL